VRVGDLRTGWQTDLILHRFGGELIEREDCLVLRTPANPTFYWGNCLVLPRAPRDEDLAHWLTRFEAEISGPQPASRHVAIGVDAPWAGEALPAWTEAGFETFQHTLLRLGPGELRPPSRAARGEVLVRPVDPLTEAEAVMDVESTDSGPFEPVGYRHYLRLQWARYLEMHAAGQLLWFGLWCDGTLAATCGLIRASSANETPGRFQHVVTHADWRRRGLASALVHAVSRHALEAWCAPAAYMLADPDDVAIGIYRSLGYREVETSWGLQRNAPQDRPA
jgi:GNAT superfamily N-acetyltransferase